MVQEKILPVDIETSFLITRSTFINLCLDNGLFMNKFIQDYLSNDPKFLSDYVTNNCSASEITSWLQLRLAQQPIISAQESSEVGAGEDLGAVSISESLVGMSSIGDDVGVGDVDGIDGDVQLNSIHSRRTKRHRRSRIPYRQPDINTHQSTKLYSTNDASMEQMDFPELNGEFLESGNVAIKEESPTADHYLCSEDIGGFNTETYGISELDGETLDTVAARVATETSESLNSIIYSDSGGPQLLQSSGVYRRAANRVPRTARNSKGRKFSCHLCEWSFTRNWLLKRHMQAIHENHRFSCHLCGKVLASQYRLSTHMRSYHHQDNNPPGLEEVIPNS